MIKIFDFILNVFLRSKQFPKPFLGISWEEFDLERKEVNKLIKLINTYKILSEKEVILHPTLFFRLLHLNKKIDHSIVSLDANSLAIEPLKKMRISCSKFMQESISMDITFNQHHEVYRNFLNTVKIQCAVLIDNFWIELDEEFEEFEINTSLV